MHYKTLFVRTFSMFPFYLVFLFYPYDPLGHYSVRATKNQITLFINEQVTSNTFPIKGEGRINIITFETPPIMSAKIAPIRDCISTLHTNARITHESNTKTSNHTTMIYIYEYEIIQKQHITSLLKLTMSGHFP